MNQQTSDYRVTFLERIPNGTRLHEVTVFAALNKEEAITRAVDGKEVTGVRAEKVG